MTHPPLFTHEDRDMLHEAAEQFYDRGRDATDMYGDKLWNLADRLQRWLDQPQYHTQYNTFIATKPEPGTTITATGGPGIRISLAADLDPENDR